MTMQLFTFGHPCEHQLRRTCIGGSSCPLNGYPDMWCCSYIKGKINFKRDKPCEGPRCRWGFNHPTQAQFTAVTRVLNEGRAIAGKIDEAEDGEILSFNIENTHTIDTVHCALNMMRHPPSSCAQRVGQLLAYAAVKTGEGKAFMQLLRTMKKPVDGYILGAYAYLKQHTASGANSAAQQKESANQSKATSGKPKANNAANSANKKDDVAEDLKNDMVDLMNAALSQGGHLVHRDDQHKLQAVFIQALRQYPKSNKKRAEMLELALGKFGNRQPSKDDAVTPAATKPAHVASAATADSAESAAEQPQKSAPASNNNANAATSNNASGKSATGGSHVEKRTSGSAAAASASVAGTASDASSTTTPTSTATQKLSAVIAASAAASHLGAGSATGANATDSSSKTSSNVAPAATVAQMLADSRRATNNNNNSTHTAASSSNGATASTSTSVSKSSTARSVAEQGATYSSVAGATSLNTVTPVAAAAATTTTTTTISAVTASVTTPAAHGKAAAAAASATVQAGAEMSVAANTTATHTPSVTAAAAAAGVSPVHSVQEKLTLNGPSRRSQTPNINCVTPVTLSEVNANTSNTTPAGIPSAVNTAAASFSLCPASSATTPHISSLPPQVQLPTQPQQAMTSEFAHPASAMFGKRVRNKLNISKLASLCTTESSSSPPSPLRSVAYTPVRAESALPSIFILGGQFALTPSMAHAAPLGLASSSGVNMSSYKELSSDPTVASSAACMVPHAAMNSMHGQGAAPNTVNMPPPQQQQPSTLFGENLFGNITAEPMFDNLDAAQLFKDFAEGWTC